MDDVTTFDGDEIERLNHHRTPNDEPAPMKSMSYQNAYVDPTRQPVHVLLHDGYHGIGGFKGDIDPDNDVCDGTYSYLQPLGRQELQYPNRVKMTSFFNYYARFTNAKVKPVFSQSRITTSVYRGSEYVLNDPIVTSFLRNANGNGASYESVQEYFLTELQVHDVVYHAMTKKSNSISPCLSTYRAIDLIDYSLDEYSELNSIMFFNGTTEIEEGDKKKTVTKAIEFYMSGGICKIQHYIGKDSYCVGKWCGNEEFQKLGEPKSTDIEEMVVYAQMTKAEPSGVILPEVPRSLALMTAQLGLFQTEGQYNWLYAVGMVPTFYMYGDMTGIGLGAGSGIAIPIQSEGSQLPPPDYIQLSSGLLDSGMKKVEFNLTRLREIAKENGVDTKTGSQAQSGDSKRFEFQATEQELLRSVNYLSDADEWVFRMLNLYTSRDSYTYHRRYPQSFFPDENATTQDLLDAIESIGSTKLNLSKNALLKTYMKKLIGRSVDRDEIEQIYNEIDSLSIEQKEDAE